MASEFIRIEKTICERYKNFLRDKYILLKDEKILKLEFELAAYVRTCVRKEKAHGKYNRHVIVSTAVILEILDIINVHGQLTSEEKELLDKHDFIPSSFISEDSYQLPVTNIKAKKIFGVQH